LSPRFFAGGGAEKMLSREEREEREGREGLMDFSSPASRPAREPKKSVFHPCFICG